MDPILRGTARERVADLLQDESRLAGEADGVAEPRDADELAAALRACAASGETVTLSSGRTGVTGGGVPRGGVAVSCRRMDRIRGLARSGEGWIVRTEPGVTLAALRDALSARRFPGEEEWDEEARAALAAFRADEREWIFPVDPTESSAGLGGMAACNASGARSFHYGSMRRYVNGFRAFLADGRTLRLRRGECQAGEGRRFAVSLEEGSRIEGVLPGYVMPAVKNAAGYYAADGMDLVDLFIGSEGTLVAFAELELALVPAPESIAGLVCFTPDEPAARALVHALREGGLGHRPLTIEFFGHRALDLLRAHRDESEGGGEIPPLPPTFHTALYIEFAGNAEETESGVEAVAAWLEENGCDADAAWMATGPREHERLKAFRHAVPEAVNLRIARLRRSAPGITKLGTDFAVPAEASDEMLSLYRERLEAEGLEHVIFGHAGDSHLHVNILPRSEEEYARGKAIYLDFARAAVMRGGTVSAEHGLGKLKTFLLPVLYGEEGVEAMRAVKRVFDPGGRLNPGTLFDF